MATLRQAVAARDAGLILELVDEECEAAHAAFHGREGFRRYWLNEPAPGGDLFAALERALALGGAYVDARGERFVLPGTALAPAMDGQGDLLGVLVADAVRLHERPGLEAPVAATLSRGPVRYCANRYVPYEVDGRRWVCLLGPGDRPGFVAAELVGNPLDPAFVFRRTGKGWRLAAFGPGVALETGTAAIETSDVHEPSETPRDAAGAGRLPLRVIPRP